MKNHSSKSTIFLTSNEPWGPLWFSKHHYAHELSRLGYQVYFINPVGPWRLKNLFSTKISIQNISTRLSILSYYNNFPVRIFPGLIIAINDFLNCLKIKRAIKVDSNRTIWWQFDFQRFLYLPFFKGGQRIYHVVDPYMHSRLDKIMAKKADLIVVVSEDYLSYYRQIQFGKKVVHIPHGISREETNVNTKKAEKIKSLFRDYIFFAGTISDDVDLGLFEAILEEGHTLVVAGKNTDLNNLALTRWKHLTDKKNFKHLGVLHVSEMKEYVAASMVCISAYKFSLQKIIGQRTPLKIIAYLSQYKPIITTTDSGIPILNGKGIYRAGNQGEFMELLGLGLNNKLEVNADAINDYFSSRFYDLNIRKIVDYLAIPLPLKVIYIISNIDKALEFEWVAKYLDRETFSLGFVLLNPNDSVLAQYIKNQGLPVIEIKYKGRRDALKAFIRLLIIFWKLKPDIIHSHLYDATMLGQIAAWIAGVKKRIYTRHHSSFNHIYHPSAVKKDKLVNILATDIVSISANVSNILTHWERVPSSKIHLVPHCLDLSLFANISGDRIDQLKKRYRIRSENSPVVGVISRYTQWKGIQYIIPAFRELLNTYPNATLVIANARKGEFVKEIDVLLSEIPTESYREIPFEKDLSALYQLFDVFVHAPVDDHSEAFGQIYIEALAAKIPSVFTISGIAKDFIKHADNAYVVDYKNSEEIVKGMITILQNKDFRNRIVNNGFDYVCRNFALDKKIQKLEDLYNG